MTSDFYSMPLTYTEPCGTTHKIRNKGDYRVILDIIAAFNDPELNDYEKGVCALKIFFDENVQLSDTADALGFIYRFINCGATENAHHALPLMDWEQDFRIIAAPINRILGTEIRAIPYLHWFSFVSAYMEIGECTFSTVVSIRSKLSKGKKLEKYEQDILRDNPGLVNLKRRVSEKEQEYIDSFIS